MSPTPQQMNAFRSMILAYQTACPGTGISPSVMAGIWFHETGGGTSAAWKTANNPGGIKRRKGFYITECYGTSDTGLYAKYPNPNVAAVVHVMFLQQGIYRAGRIAPDDSGQIRAFAVAGYVGNDGADGANEPANWIAGVGTYAALARKIIGEQAALPPAAVVAK